MCIHKTIDEHDRLETIVELVHEASHANDHPIDLYRVRDYLLTTDEPEDDVAEANHQVGAAFGHGFHDDEEVEDEDEDMPDAIEEFLNSTWPNEERVEGGEEDDAERGMDKEVERADDDGNFERTNDTDAPAAEDIPPQQTALVQSADTNRYPDVRAAEVPATDTARLRQAALLRAVILNPTATSGDTYARARQARNA